MCCAWSPFAKHQGRADVKVASSSSKTSLIQICCLTGDHVRIGNVDYYAGTQRLQARRNTRCSGSSFKQGRKNETNGKISKADDHLSRGWPPSRCFCSSPRTFAAFFFSRCVGIHMRALPSAARFFTFALDFTCTHPSQCCEVKKIGKADNEIMKEVQLTQMQTQEVNKYKHRSRSGQQCLPG